MRKSHILRIFENAGLVPGCAGIRSYFSEGMNAPYLVHPQNVIAWHSSGRDDLSGEFVHQRFVFKTVLQGHIRILLDGHSSRINPGEGILISPFQVHLSREAGPETEQYHYAAVTFTLSADDAERLEPLRNHIFRMTRENIRALTGIIAGFQSTNGPLQEKAVWLLSGLLQEKAAEAEGPVSQIRNMREEKFQKIMEYLRSNLREPLSLKVLAYRFGISTETLRRQFHAHFQRATPAELIRRLRFQRAQELLERTDAAVADIAGECGYSSPFTFSSAFKKVYGKSPSACRKYYRSR